MLVATGHSEDLESADAIREALDRCAAALGDRVPRAGLLFAGIEHDHQVLLDGVQSRYPGIQLIGCTTHGELSSAGFAEDSIVLVLFHSDRVQFSAGVGEGVRTDTTAAARAVSMALAGIDEPVRLCIALPEGIGGEDGSAPGTIRAGLLETLGEALGSDVPVCGGLAGDQFRFTGSYQFCNGKVCTDAMPVLLFAGPLHVAASVACGWEAVGGDHRVTESDGMIVAGIDEENPRDMWMRYFGSVDLSGPRNSFAVYPDGDDGQESEDFYLSLPSRFHEDGSMITMTPVPQNARIRFASATREQALDGAAASARKARASYPGGEPEAALVFSCAGRHSYLGTQVAAEVGLILQEVGSAVPMVGFYTYGEICQLPTSHTPFQHSGTIVTVLMGEHE